MPFDQTPERGGGDDDEFTFDLGADVEIGRRYVITFVNMAIGLEFTAPTHMPKGTTCTVKRLACGVRMLSYRLDGIAAEFVIVVQVVPGQ